MDSMFYDPRNQDRFNPRDRVDEISDRLLQVPIGHHRIILYPDLARLRIVYSNYIEAQLEDEDPTATILFLPYYETSDKVREVLVPTGINVKAHEKRGSLILVDVMKALASPGTKVPNLERLPNFISQVYDANHDKTLILIADMSVFHNLKMSLELLDYEGNLHQTLETVRWKGLCLYNERDIETMLTEEHATRLLSYHKESVILN